MKTVKGAAVTSAKSERQCKDAVDAIYAALRPDYIVILDAPDVVPHLALDNPTPGDKDANVPSDLPYACDAPFTSRDAAKYSAVTRVVGRITGITERGVFVLLLEHHVEGYVPFPQLARDWYERDETGLRVVGRDTRRVLRLGDPLRVRVAEVDELRRRITLAEA